MGLRVRTRFSGLQGGSGLSTIFFAGPGDQSSANAAQAAVTAFWQAMDNLMDNGVGWATEAEVAFVDPLTDDVTAVFTTTSASGTGIETADPLPFATQLVCNVRTGHFIAGREIRGRIFVPGLTEGANGTNGQASSSTVSSTNTALTALRTGANHQLVVYSRTHNQDRVATAATVNPDWAILRSRRD